VTVLLVGATGFLGSFVARRLVERDVVALVRPSSDRSGLPRNISTREGDLSGDLPLSGIDTLVYCASMGLRPGPVPPLVRRLEAAGVRRAVFVSTTAIFTRLPATSRSTPLEAERAVQTSRLAWTILRPTMIYGTARDRNISRLLRLLDRWPLIPVCGSGLWQPVHVEDVADAVVAAVDSPRAEDAAYNLAGKEPLHLAEMIRVAAQALGTRVWLVPVPLPAAVLAARLTHVVTPEQVWRLAEDKAFDYTEATRDLGFLPRSFEEGVRQEVRCLGLPTRRRWPVPRAPSPRPSGPAPRR
jgi:nucleoside-diphosphate-sugar epimerase